MKRLVRWGEAVLGLMSLIGLIRLLHQPFSGHFRVFTTAGRLLWQGQDAYGSDFGTGVGYWFYSPGCGLFFFGPLGLLPEWLGLLVYMLLGLAVFYWGAKQWLKALELSQQREQLFFALIAPQVMTAILAAKLELLMTGILFLAASWLGWGQRRVLSTALLALIVNWKFQTLPSVGLMLLSLLILKRDWKSALSFAGMSGVLVVAPALVSPKEYLVRQHQIWSATLSDFVSQSWTHFDNGYSFMTHGLGLKLNYPDLQFWAGGGALLALGLQLAVLVNLRKNLEPGLIIRQALTLSLALGAWYSIWFSPLHQNNASIIYAPLLLGLLWTLERSLLAHRHRWARGLSWLLWSGCGIMILAYSDVVPLVLREGLREVSIKALVCLVFCGAIVAEGFSGHFGKT